MASNRNLVFINDGIYHIYNRGVERRKIFTNKREYTRFIELIDYYRHHKPPIRFSKFLTINVNERNQYHQKLSTLAISVDVLAFCLMPNHFHLLLRQTIDKGISKFLSYISNGYAKYFNIKYHRVGPLFQSAFKAIFIETDEELMHVSRYIHLNSIASSLVKTDSLFTYPWSSLIDYMKTEEHGFIEKSTVLDLFLSPKTYKQFILDQVGYAKTLERMKHVLFEELVSSQFTRRVTNRVTNHGLSSFWLLVF